MTYEEFLNYLDKCFDEGKVYHCNTNQIISFKEYFLKDLHNLKFKIFTGISPEGDCSDPNDSSLPLSQYKSVYVSIMQGEYFDGRLLSQIDKLIIKKFDNFGINWDVKRDACRQGNVSLPELYKLYYFAFEKDKIKTKYENML